MRIALTAGIWAMGVALGFTACNHSNPQGGNEESLAGTAASSVEATTGADVATTSSAATGLGGAASGDGMWVARPDGALGCKPDSGQSLDTGAEDLKKAGVTILESRKGSDHKMHIQVCGAPTGSQNAYRIPRSELEKVKALGFQPAPVAK